jgi:hypothetical protein
MIKRKKFDAGLLNVVPEKAREADAIQCLIVTEDR